MSAEGKRPVGVPTWVGILLILTIFGLPMVVGALVTGRGLWLQREFCNELIADPDVSISIGQACQEATGFEYWRDFIVNMTLSYFWIDGAILFTIYFMFPTLLKRKPVEQG